MNILKNKLKFNNNKYTNTNTYNNLFNNFLSLKSFARQFKRQDFVKTINIPKSDQEKESLYKSQPKFTSKLDVNPEHIDPYLQVGQEVFTNRLKKEFLNSTEKGFEYLRQDRPLIQPNTEIKPKREIKDESFGPLKEDYFLLKPDRVEAFQNSRFYMDTSKSLKNTHIFTPSYKEKNLQVELKDVTSPDILDNDITKHNFRNLLKLQLAPGFKTKSSNINITTHEITYDYQNENIKNNIKEIKTILNKYKSNFEYPDSINDILATDKFSYAIENNNLVELRNYFTFIPKDKNTNYAHDSKDYLYNETNINNINTNHELKDLFNLCKLTKEIYNEIDNVDPTLLSNLMLSLHYELNLNIFLIWNKIEQIYLNKIHHFSLAEICKMNYITNMPSNKRTSSRFREELNNEILKNDFNNLAIDDLLNVIVGLRSNRKINVYEDLCVAIVENKQRLINSDENPEKIISELYILLALFQPKVNNKNYILRKEENDLNLFEGLLDEMLINTNKMDLISLDYLLNAISLFRIEHVDAISNRAERNILKRIESNSFYNKYHEKDVQANNNNNNSNSKYMSPALLSNILHSFNRLKRNNMAGSNNGIFNIIKKQIVPNLENYTINQFSVVLNTLSMRSLLKDDSADINKEVKTAIEKHISTILNNNNNKDNTNNTINTHKDASNFIYYLMIHENTDLNLNKKLLSQIEKINGKLKVMYYLPYKSYDLYLRNHPGFKNNFTYESEEIFQLRDRFYYAEQMFNVSKHELSFENDKNHQFILARLRAMNYFFLSCVSFNNLFNIHFALETRKIAIFIYDENNYVYKSHTDKGIPIIHERVKLPAMLLKLSGWEVIEFTWYEYVNAGNIDVRDKMIFDLVEEATDKQVKKGLYERDPLKL